MASLIVPEGMPDPVVAGSIIMTLCKAAGVATLGEVVGGVLSEKRRRLVGDICLSDEQVGLLEEYDWLGCVVRVKNPVVTVQMCPVCGLMEFVSGACSMVCHSPLGCGGRMVRAAVLKKREG